MVLKIKLDFRGRIPKGDSKFRHSLEDKEVALWVWS